MPTSHRTPYQSSRFAKILVQFLDRVLKAGSTLWVLSVDAAKGTANVRFDGSCIETVPSKSVAILSNFFREALRGHAHSSPAILFRLDSDPLHAFYCG